MSAVAFHWLDVFTSRPFGGNPLAVVPDAERLTDQQMRSIAAELNLSETVFVMPPTQPGALRLLRIFTPAMELPYAGHPTVGTAVLLAELGVVDATVDGTQMVLQEQAGPVTVTVRAAPGSPTSATLTAPQPVTVAPSPPAGDVARIVGLDPSDLADDVAPAVVSVGVPFLLIPVTSVEALARARVDLEAWRALVAGRDGQHLYVFNPPAQGEISARMFAPAMGIAEDPATGAGATALAGYLASLGGGDGSRAWTVSQGAAVGRPSRLHIEAEVDGASVTAVRVGGAAVRVADGVLHLPG